MFLLLLCSEVFSFFSERHSPLYTQEPIKCLFGAFGGYSQCYESSVFNLVWGFSLQCWRPMSQSHTIMKLTKCLPELPNVPSFKKPALLSLTYLHIGALIIQFSEVRCPLAVWRSAFLGFLIANRTPTYSYGQFVLLLLFLRVDILRVWLFCLWIRSLHIWCRWGAAEGIRPWDWSGNCEPPNGYRELSSDPLQEQPKDVNIRAVANSPPICCLKKRTNSLFIQPEG